MKIEEDVIVEILESFTFVTNQDNSLDVFVRYKDINGDQRFVRSENQEFLAFVRDSYRKKANTL